MAESPLKELTWNTKSNQFTQKETGRKKQENKQLN